MEKAIHYNPLHVGPTADKPRDIQTDWKIVNEFWINTNVGPLMAGEIWKDTSANRQTIQKIEYQKQEWFRMDAEIKKVIHQLMNLKER